MMISWQRWLNTVSFLPYNETFSLFIDPVWLCCSLLYFCICIMFALTHLLKAEGHHDSALTHFLYTAIAFLGVADHKVSKAYALHLIWCLLLPKEKHGNKSKSFLSSVLLFILSGWSCSAGGLLVSEGGLPYGLPEIISGNWWCKTPLCPWQPGFCHGAAALGHSALCDHRSKWHTMWQNNKSICM